MRSTLCKTCIGIIEDHNRYVVNGKISELCSTCMLEDDNDTSDISRRMDRLVENLIPAIELLVKLKGDVELNSRNHRALHER